MTERPILFSAPMVRAILAGQKTQTRRIAIHKRSIEPMTEECPYGKPGDRLWVRETHMDLGGCLLYRADHGSEVERASCAPRQRWAPSIHMPRWASRITLEVTGVRVERLQGISDSDARAEGVDQDAALSMACTRGAARAAYSALWEQIHGPGSWDANPWVWVVEFRRDFRRVPQ